MSDTIQCGNCQTELPGDAVFCFTCGSQLQGEVRCRSCSAANPAGSQFCQQCGTTLPSPGETESDPLDEMRADLCSAGDKLALAAEQNRLNERELELYTDERRASKQAETQQRVNAARLDVDADSTIEQHTKEARHRADLDDAQRRDESDQQREQFQRGRQDRELSHEHQQKLVKWERKKAELDREMVFKRQAIEDLQEIDEKQRAYKLQKLAEEHAAKIEQARRQLAADTELKGAEQEARIARTETEFEHTLKLKTAQQQAEREQLREQRSDDLDHDRSRSEFEHEQDARDLKLAMDAQKQLLDWKQQGKDAEVRRGLEALRGETEVQTAAQQAAHEMELERISKLNELSPEALIATSPAEQAKLLAELRQTEALKGMSEEQILARAAERSPEVAQAIAEKYKSAGSQAAKQEMQALYERMFTAQSSQSQQQLEAMQRLMETALQTQRDTSVAAASGGRVVPAEPVKIASPNHCTHCGNVLPGAARFCGKCGTAQS
ncbi:MAG: zinc ribbon domain-containing protein [Planctomycetaceae bacterium]